MADYEDEGSGVVDILANGIATFSAMNYGNTDQVILILGTDQYGNIIPIGTTSLICNTSGSASGAEGSEIYPNTEWELDASVAGEFMWGRLMWQKNPHASRDSGPEIFGTIVDEDLSPILYTLLYNKANGNVTLNNEIQFNAGVGVKKIDFSFDVFGYPVYAYTRANDSAVLRRRNISTGTYENIELGDNITNIFVCGCERRLPANSTYNRIYIIYERDGLILTRRSEVEDFEVEISTGVSIPERLQGAIEGFGVTDEFRIQARLKVRRRYG